jgi:alkylhydroperoxidase family enzyme
MEEMAPALQERLGPRVERLGYLGEFFRCAAHQPRALSAFLAFTDDLKGALPDELTEVVALTVAARMDSAYERVQHERLSLTLGFGEDWIRAVLGLRPQQSSLPEAQRLVQDLVLAMIERNGHDTGRELAEVVRVIGAAQAVAVLLLVGRYVTHALFVNALNLAPPVSSIVQKTGGRA